VQVFRLDQRPGKVYPPVNLQLRGELLECASRRTRADQHQVHILIQTLQRTQRHGVILHRRETCHHADEKGPRRNAPAVAPGAAHLDGDAMEGALFQEIWQFNDARRRHALGVNHQPCDQRAVDHHAVREAIAATVEGQETRSRARIQKAATRNNATAGQPRPRCGKDVGIDIVRMHDLDSFAPEQPQEAHTLHHRAQ